jgi:hypothetical protein
MHPRWSCCVWHHQCVHTKFLGGTKVTFRIAPARSDSCIQNYCISMREEIFSKRCSSAVVCLVATGLRDLLTPRFASIAFSPELRVSQYLFHSISQRVPRVEAAGVSTTASFAHVWKSGAIKFLGAWILTSPQTRTSSFPTTTSSLALAASMRTWTITPATRMGLLSLFCLSS